MIDDIDTIGVHPGYTGAFTSDEASGALPNGTRVVKIGEDASGDMTKIGTTGVVLGSLDMAKFGIFYFIEWDDKPKKAVGCRDWKIAAIITKNTRKE